MRKSSYTSIKAIANLGLLLWFVTAVHGADPLSSWNDTPTKQAIVAFVQAVTTPGSPGFVPVAERIATFDNDGTLWSEQPLYFQYYFSFDRVLALAPQHPEWTNQEPFASVLKGDYDAVLAGGAQASMILANATIEGAAGANFDKVVTDWIATARNPMTGRLLTEMVFAPMVELLSYLRANEFKTYMVSGGNAEFLRPWVEQTYGIPPEQVIGSNLKTKYELVDGKPVIVRLPEYAFVDDQVNKPLAIESRIGRRPIAAFGNSDGDQQMLEWTAAGSGPRLCLLVHHTDAEREWAYDRTSPIGHLDTALNEASVKGWTVVDMKSDWKVIHAARSGQPMSIEREKGSGLIRFNGKLQSAIGVFGPWRDVPGATSPHAVSVEGCAQFYRGAE